mmetsp:Transcript_26202/g.57197  ORF Transcript_26202/g.57197 Transcript_26202/m.57197 type:complete len:240 (+) Transcript_26202:111-830(+)
MARDSTTPRCNSTSSPLPLLLGRCKTVAAAILLVAAAQGPRSSRGCSHLGLGGCLAFRVGARVGAHVGATLLCIGSPLAVGILILVLILIHSFHRWSLALAWLWDWALAQGLAHVGEEPLRLLVHLFLAFLGLLQQGSRLSVLRIHLDHTLAIFDGLDEILEAVLGLGAPVQGLRIRLLVLQDCVASGLGLCVVLELQVACGLVELAHLLQLLGLDLVLFLVVVDVAEEVTHLLIALQG